MIAIETQDLTFGYDRKKTIIKGLNLRVPEGSIYGFLGSNGAGKSTTIRTILGLLKAQSGSIHLLGQELSSAPVSLFQRVGTLIESPSLYPQLSAREHLRLACRYHRVAPARIDTLLEQVGLSAHHNKKSKQFSTGMKQRLGLAMALVHEPQLLILDEPTNGLDPQGISDIRDLLLELRAAGKTILLSSHLLSEIERIATQVGILKDGNMRFQGSIAELEQWKNSQLILLLRTNQPAQAQQQLDATFPDITSQADALHIRLRQEGDIPEIIRQLVAQQIDIYEVRLQKNDLETLFMEATLN